MKKLNKLLKRRLLFVVRDKVTFLPLFVFSGKGYKLLFYFFSGSILVCYLLFLLFSSTSVFYFFTPLGKVALYDESNKENIKLIDSLYLELERNTQYLSALNEVIPDGFIPPTSLGRVFPIMPLKKAIVSQMFNPEEKHYAIDFVAKKGARIRSILAGTVLVSTWTDDTGNVMLIQHANGLISLYKHCDTLFYKSGQSLLQGTIIGTVGETGALNIGGPHLHLEIWRQGIPIDPAKILPK